jgi:hypothetical protein
MQYLAKLVSVKYPIQRLYGQSIAFIGLMMDFCALAVFFFNQPPYFYCSDFNGVTMPSFEKFYLLPFQGFMGNVRQWSA